MQKGIRELQMLKVCHNAQLDAMSRRFLAVEVWRRIERRRSTRRGSGHKADTIHRDKQ
jgi:hypothetical protein